jgi:hypothetical protein
LPYPGGTAVEHAFEGKSYWYNQAKASWEDAQAACQQQGGNLVKIESAAATNFIQNTVMGGKTLDTWIGCNDK